MLNRSPQYEIIGYAPSKRISCREFRLPAFPSPYHQHLEVEITAILSSTGSLHVAGEVLSFGPGDCFVLGSNLPHKFHNDPNPNANDADQPEEQAHWAHSIVLQFDEAVFLEGLVNLPELAPVRKWLRNAKQGLHLKGKPAGEMVELLRQILTTKGIEQVAHLLNIFVLLESLNEVETLIPYQQPAGFNSRSTTRISQVMQHLYEHLSEKIQLEDLANVVGMNRSSFSRFFKNATGKNVVDFLHEIRFREVCRLLHQTDQSITEIAFKCGYENLSTFNRCFRKLGGMTPKEYRNFIHFQGLCKDPE